MGITTIGSATHLFARPYAAADETAVLGLVNADRLPGQPQTTSAMLAEALAGHSPVDSGWWAELDVPRQVSPLAEVSPSPRVWTLPGGS